MQLKLIQDCPWTIVSRGDWLWNSANIKGRNNSRVSGVENIRHVTLTVHTENKMADVMNNLSIFEDNFLTILKILESDEGMEKQFVSKAIKVYAPNLKAYQLVM